MFCIRFETVDCRKLWQAWLPWGKLSPSYESFLFFFSRCTGWYAVSIGFGAVWP